MKCKGLLYEKLPTLCIHIEQRANFWGLPGFLLKVYRRLLPPGVQRPERVASHPTPPRFEVKTEWTYTLFPLYTFNPTVTFIFASPLP
jgi:hypothetical protein